MSQMKRNITKIKMAQKHLGMDDDSYRALLKRMTGKSSATTLTLCEQGRVLTEMERLGFSFRKANQGKQYTKGSSRKLIMLWGDLHKLGHVQNKANKAMEAWVKIETGKPNPDWLTPAEANRCIEALKQWSKRPVKTAMDKHT